MKDALLIYLLGSLLALIVLKVYSSQDIDEVTGAKGAQPDMDMMFWTIALSWISVILGSILITFNYRERRKRNAADK